MRDPHATTGPRRRAGFSLPELIVVLGLIMLLLGLLAPATSRAWRQADAVKCRAQLYQLGLALSMYANENRGASVPFGNGPDPMWPEVAFGEPNPAVLVCPTGVGEDTLSYQLNWWLRFRSSIKMDGSNSSGLSPSQIPLAGESWPGQTTYYSSVDAEGVISWDPARHGPGLLSNYLWLDLHVDNTAPQAIPPSNDPWKVLP